MFICKTCLRKKYENHGVFISIGKCENCKKYQECYDIPSKYLKPKHKLIDPNTGEELK